MKFMYAGYSRNRVDEVSLETHQVNVWRNRVEEDKGGVSEEWPRGDADDDHDDQRQERVKIVLVLPVCQPDDGGTDQDDNTAKCIRK